MMETQMLTMISEGTGSVMTGFLMWYLIRQETKYEAREQDLRNRYDKVVAHLTARVDELHRQIQSLIAKGNRNDNGSN